MGSLDSLEVKALKAQGVVYQVGTDTPIAIRLTYVGTGSGVTSVTTTTATNIVIVADGYTQTYPFAAGLTLNTIGELVDAINVGNCTEAAGGKLFNAEVVDSLRSLATASQFVDGAITSSVVEGVTVWDVLVDTDAADYFCVRLAADRDPGVSSIGKRVKLFEINYAINFGTADTVKIYEVDGTTEKEIFSTAAVDTTATSLTWGGGFRSIDSGYGRDLVVYSKDSGNLVNAATNYLRVVGVIE